jgi:hypothetical protein
MFYARVRKNKTVYLKTIVLGYKTVCVSSPVKELITFVGVLRSHNLFFIMFFSKVCYNIINRIFTHTIARQYKAYSPVVTHIPR